MATAVCKPNVLEVKVWGMDVDDQPFRTQAQVCEISDRGVRLRGRFNLLAGDTIAVENAGRKARFKVAWVGERFTDLDGSIGVEAIEETDIWSSSASKRRVSMPAKPIQVNRRRHERFKCHGGADVRMLDAMLPSYGTLADLSLGGCYIEMLTPFALGSELDLTVRVSETGHTFRARGVVKTSHAMVGMGIEFTGMLPEDRENAEAVIAKLAAQQKDALLAAKATAADGGAKAALAPAGVAARRSRAHQAKETQLAKTAIEIHLLQNLFAESEVDPRLLEEMRETLGYARYLITLVTKWLDLKKEGRDPNLIVPAFLSGRLREAATLNRHVAADLAAHDIGRGTEGVGQLYDAVAGLAHTLLTEPGSRTN